MASDASKLRVAIIGGGVGGIMLALSLVPFENIEIDIYEGASKFEMIGAGLMIWGEAIIAFRKLGIEDRLIAIKPNIQDPNPMYLRKANLEVGREMGAMTFSRAMGFHRGILLDCLVEILEETKRATIHFGKRCIGYVNAGLDGGEVIINFKDGTTATCHALVGSDGIKSVIRKHMLEEMGWKPTDHGVDSSGLRFTGTVAYRALINPASLGDHVARKINRMYCGSYKHIVTYPIAGGAFINFVGYTSDPARHDEWKNAEWTFDEKDTSAVQKEFGVLEEEVRVLLQVIEKCSRWALYDVELMPHWSEGCVTVLGDAAHSMPPFMGSGGGQVIEDAYILAQLLGNPAVTRKDIPHVLRSYEHVRKPRADKVLNCTREAKRALESLEEYADATDEYIEQALHRLVNWLWQGNLDLDEEIERGRRELERLRQESLQESLN